MKEPKLGSNKIQSYIDFETTRGKVRLAIEGLSLVAEHGEDKRLLISEEGAFITDIITERTPATGVTIDGVLLKDGTVTTTAPEIKSVDPAITAHAGGTKAAAYVLTKELNIVTVCTTALDSLLLPVAVVGLGIIVVNLGVTACAIYGAGTNTIDDIATANPAIIKPEDVVTFYCYTAAKWQSDFEAEGVYDRIYTDIISENTAAAGVTIAGVLLKDSALDTNVAAAGVTLAGTTLAADGTNANIDINITPKGTGEVNIPKVDIDAGTVDGTDITVGAGKTLNVSADTLALADNQISGDKVEGGTINAITINTLAGTTANIITLDTNVAAAGVTLAGKTLAADGTDAAIPITITPKGAAGIETAAGVVGTPAYSFTGQPDMGLYKLTAAQLGVAISGALATLFDADGLKSDSVQTKNTFGSTPVGTVTFKEYGDSRDFTTVCTLTDFVVGALAGAAAALGVGNVVYAFPAGQHVELVYSLSALVLKAAGTAVNTDTGLGSVIASGAIATLNGTTTFEDRLTGQTIATAPAGGAAVSALTGATGGIGTGIALNVAASVKNVFLNSAGTWNADNTGNLTASGVIVLKWSLMS